MVAVQVGASAYVSSVGSEALAMQLGQSCLPDLGVATVTLDPVRLERRADVGGEPRRRGRVVDCPRSM
jgi:hypothetical protein